MVVIKILDKVTILTAIVGVVVLDAYALSKGINGTGLVLAIATIAGLGGYEVDRVVKYLRK